MVDHIQRPQQAARPSAALFVVSHHVALWGEPDRRQDRRQLRVSRERSYSRFFTGVQESGVKVHRPRDVDLVIHFA